MNFLRQLKTILFHVFSDRAHYSQNFYQSYRIHRIEQNAMRILIIFGLVLAMGLPIFVLFSLGLLKAPGENPLRSNILQILRGLFIVALVYALIYPLLLRAMRRQRWGLVAVTNDVLLFVLYGFFALMSINAQHFHGSVVQVCVAGFAGGIIFYSGRWLATVTYVFAAIPITLAIIYLQDDANLARIRVGTFLVLNAASFATTRFMFHFRARSYHTLLQLRAKDKENREQLMLASKIQRQMLPKENYFLKDLQVSARWRSMEAVGGDLLDYIEFKDENHLGIFVGDVLGRGVPAALIITSIKTILRSISTDLWSDPSALLKEINNRLIAQAPGNFLGSIYGILDAEENTFEYARAGLPYPLQLLNNEITEYQGDSDVLGRTTEPIIDKGHVALQPGGHLLLFNFGLYNSCDDPKDLFKGQTNGPNSLQLPAKIRFDYEQSNDEISLVSISRECRKSQI